MALLPLATAAGELPSASGVYPHLAALSTSYSESGIGAVVPWADRLWYVSYVAHKGGGGVGLYEITPELKITRRPESVVGTHAGRMIHRETNQLIIGPYVIDSRRQVRLFRWLAENERVTAVMRHLTDPGRKVYFMAMEGKFYEGDLQTLETREIIDLKRHLGVRGNAHFKGGYTAQGRVVVANNSYAEGDQQRGSGDGRLAEWDGRRWTILGRTAYCDVTTAAGVNAVAGDDSPLWAIGWDRRSVLLSVLADGGWSTYRLPKATAAYDHAWCTEWPRIREIGRDPLLMDMHGMFYLMPADFRPGAAGGLVPLSSHLRLVPDFCQWQGRLVMAGDEVISQGGRNRTGGQPQSNLLFTSLEEISDWGPVKGWGGPWLNDPVKRGQPSQPFLLAGHGRSLHLAIGTPAAARYRTAGRFEITQLPAPLAALPSVAIDRGSMDEPGPAYSFEVDRNAVVYLAVQERGDAGLRTPWEKTALRIHWRHGGVYADAVYRQSFAAGRVDIPGHRGQDARGKYGVPHLAFVAPAQGTAEVQIRPTESGAAIDIARPGKWPADAARFLVEVDRDGAGRWTTYKTFDVAADRPVWEPIDDSLQATWARVTAMSDTLATAQFYLGQPLAAGKQEQGPYTSIPRLQAKTATVGGGLMPLANRLWFSAYQTDQKGETEPLGLYEIDESMRPVRRAESLDGVFANRLMVNESLLSIGPHLIGDDGTVRTIESLKGEHLVATMRHPDADKIYLLAAGGRLFEADLGSLEATPAADIARQLGLEDLGLIFRAGHLVGNVLLVAASTADGRGGCLAECRDGHWTVLDRRAYGELTNPGVMSEAVVAVGGDAASVVLKVRATDGSWSTWRLPWGSGHGQSAAGWPRLREVETERMLLNAGGTVYEMSSLLYAWSLRPVTTHDRRIDDFCSWRGLTVLAGAAASGDAATLAFGKTDDLWHLGRPRGHGGPWLKTTVRAGEPSDPFLVFNFERRQLTVEHDAAHGVQFDIEACYGPANDEWQKFARLDVAAGKQAMLRLPESFSGHWVRLVARDNCQATAQFSYE